jgi:hypothetical protein
MRQITIIRFPAKICVQHLETKKGKSTHPNYIAIATGNNLHHFFEETPQKANQRLS